LDTEGTPTEPSAGPIHPWRARIKIANDAWIAIKNISAIGATAVMLSAAGYLVWHHVTAPAAPHSRVPVPVRGAVSSAPPIRPVSNGIFQDVPVPLSDQESMLKAVQIYNDQNGKSVGDRHLDEISIKGNEGSVRYRSKDILAFTLVRKNGVWTVTSVN
jgi:hypothetical protein